MPNASASLAQRDSIHVVWAQRSADLVIWSPESIAVLTELARLAGVCCQQVFVSSVMSTWGLLWFALSMRFSRSKSTQKKTLALSSAYHSRGVIAMQTALKDYSGIGF